MILFTGFPGFIGARLIPRLLELAPDTTFHALVQEKFLSAADASVAALADAPGGSRLADPGAPPATGAAAPADPPASTRAAVLAPLTGIFYASPSPGSPPFVEAGREVVVGQVIGLIEAMKLFNEIKSDKAGRVVRVVPEDGALVKAKHPLIEVEPL